MECAFCSVAVSVAGFGMDKPYSYLIPDQLIASLKPGMRVVVPFGRGNRKSEGIVLAVSQGTPERTMKWVSALLDEEPVIEEGAIRLALWMREHYFCTVYDALKAMLPGGLYYNLQDLFRLDAEASSRELTEAEGEIVALFQERGGSIQRRDLQTLLSGRNRMKTLRELVAAGVITVETSAQRGVGDKSEEIAALILSPEEAIAAVAGGRSHLRRAVVEYLSNEGSASVKEIRYYTGASRKTLKDLERMGLVELLQREVFRRPPMDEIQPQAPPVLNEEQRAACESLTALMHAEDPACALLYGVTGSGKTEVYINLIHNALASGKTALVLVPEIGLTPQLLTRFAAQFGEQVAVLHSSLSAGERYDEWKRVKRGEAGVVIGTRSAVFAPLPHLGVIILDEEQESSYKSEQNPRYHARDVAKYRCAQNRGLLVLGSATPSVESMFYAKNGRYHLFTLQHRYNDQAMPRVEIVDLRREIRSGNASCLSTSLRGEIQQNLDRGEQTILLLNRRGTSSMVVCTQCGDVPECPRCSVHLTYHSANRRLMCHYCGYSQAMPENCPQCGGGLSFYGVGIQMVEEELRDAFPGTEVLRMDADTVSAAHPHRQLLERFQRERIPILIGTQMVAKGLDFSNVTLAGVIDADLGLFVDSYRAAERTFSLLTQVVGRAGRGERAGRAIIQTLAPEHEVIQAAAAQDYDRFYEQEIALRRERQFPPWTDLVWMTVSGEDEALVLRCCVRLREGLEAWRCSVQMKDTPFQVLGPAPAGILKVNGRFRYRLMIFGAFQREMRAMIAALLNAGAADRQNRGVTIAADWNPMD